MVCFAFLPIAVLSIIAGFFIMKNVTERTFPHLDVKSVILSTFGFGGLLYGFSTAGNNGWGNPNVFAGIVLVPIFFGNTIMF